MHLIDFYYELARFSDFLPILPILMALVKWQKLSVGLKCFLGYLLADLLINIASYTIHANNRFLGYFYSFSYCAFILSSYFFFFKDAKEKKFVIFIFFFCVFLLLIDYGWIDKTNQNYLSDISIDWVIVGISIYYFSRYFVQKSRHFIEINHFISIVLIFQFLVKAIESLLDKFLIETLKNGFLWLQMRNIYYYFMIFSFLIISLIFYKWKPNEYKK